MPKIHKHRRVDCPGEGGQLVNFSGGGNRVIHQIVVPRPNQEHMDLRFPRGGSENRV